MRNALLTTYLNDHLAGSVAAVELVEHLVQLTKGTQRERFFLTLGREIQEDQETLRLLLQEMGGKESRARKAAAWLTEKLGKVKLRLDDKGEGHLRLLEALETLALGIQGKAALWRGLEAIADQMTALRSLDLPHLQGRANDQFQRVEAQRLQVVRAAFDLDEAGTAAPAG
jgi:hypothetical protein